MRKYRNFVIYSDSEEFPKENVKLLEKAMHGFVYSNVRLAVEFVFVDEEEIRRLNLERRQIDKVTDVLSFPTLDGIKGERFSKSNSLAILTRTEICSLALSSFAPSARESRRRSTDIRITVSCIICLYTALCIVLVTTI